MTKLRYHHGLCCLSFEEKGYSDAFVKNMQHIIENLKDVEWIEGCDEICNKCPHCIEGSCTSEKVNRYDAKVKAIVCKDRGNWAEQKAIFAGLIFMKFVQIVNGFLCVKKDWINSSLSQILRLNRG